MKHCDDPDGWQKESENPDEIERRLEGLHQCREKGDIVMEKRREDKCIVLTLPRSQWVNRKVKMMEARANAAVKKLKRKYRVSRTSSPEKEERS